MYLKRRTLNLWMVRMKKYGAETPTPTQNAANKLRTFQEALEKAYVSYKRCQALKSLWALKPKDIVRIYTANNSQQTTAKLKFIQIQRTACSSTSRAMRSLQTRAMEVMLNLHRM